MADTKRKADSLAGKGSFAAALRARRQALEAGNPEGGRQAYLDELKIEVDKIKKQKRK